MKASKHPPCPSDKGRGPCGGPLTTLADGDPWPDWANLRCAMCGEWASGTAEEQAQRADRALERRWAQPLPEAERERRALARQRGLVAKLAQAALPLDEEARRG